MFPSISEYFSVVVWNGQNSIRPAAMFTGINPSSTVLVYKETTTCILFFLISSVIENPHYCLQLIKITTALFLFTSSKFKSCSMEKRSF